MIISHKRKFIFIKTEKTAGTSLEIALSKFCGEEDIITRLSPDEEALRKKLNDRNAQNFYIPLKRYSKFELLNRLFRKKKLSFRQHDGATKIKKYLSEEQWNTYYKFCFERNPWDKVVSYYYWFYHWKGTPEHEFPSISEFIHSGMASRVRGFDLYTIDSKVVVDKMYFFEDLPFALEDIQKRLELPESLNLPKAKSSQRKSDTNYKTTLSEDDITQIAKIFAREIAYWNYKP
ncbi:MAG TPA: hypothetical protein PK299_03590 [Anaerolineales bacterium]|nr:hypothetical protein [Anaerolineales bacterium]